MIPKTAIHRAGRALSTGCAALLLAGNVSLAATFQWIGGTDTNWNTAANWDAGVPASAADTALVFNNIAGLTLNNNIPGGLTLNSLALGAGSGGSTFTGGALTFSGAGALLTKASTAGNVVFDTPLVLNTHLTVNALPTLSSQLLLGGAISGTGGLHFADGVHVVYGANTFSGTTQVSAGVLGVAGSGLAATSGITVASGAELQILRVNSTTSTTVNRPLTLGGLLSTASRRIPGIFGSTPASAFYSGAITLSGDADFLAFGGVGTGLNGVELSVSGPVNLAGHKLTVRNGGAFDAVSIFGAISGAGNLDIRPNGGSVNLPNISGNRDVLISAASGGAVNIASLSNDGLLSADYGGIVSPAKTTVTGAVNGLRNIVVRGGRLELQSTASTFTGSIEARENGILMVQNSNRLGNAANSITLRDSGALQLTSGGTFPRAIVLANGGNLLGTGLQTVSGNITGNGGLSVAQTQWTLTGNNTFTGGLNIVGTTVVYNNDTNLGAAGGRVRLEGGQLNLPAALTTFNRPIETILSGQPGTLVAAAGQAVTIESDITGAGAMVFGSRAVWTLTGNNTFAGGLIVLGGGLPTTVVAASENNLGGANAPIIFGDQPTVTSVRPATLRAAGNITIPVTRPTDFRSLTVDTAGHTVTFLQPLTGRGLTKTGAGLFVLGGTVTPTSGSENTITIQQGTLRTGAANVIHSTTGVLVAEGALLDLDGFSQTIGGISAFGDIVLGSGTLSTTGGTVESVISGTGGLAVRNGGNLQLFGANTFSGGLAVTGGARVFAHHPQALGAAGNAITLDNGGIGVSSLTPAPLVIDATANLTIGAGGASFSAEGQRLIIARQLVGTAPLRFSGGSPLGHGSMFEVRLTHPANTFVSNIQLGDSSFSGFGDATLGIVANGSLGDAANVITLGDAFDTGEGFSTSTGTLRAFADIVFPASRTIQLKGNAGDGGGALDTNGHTITVDTAISQVGTAGLQIGGGGTVLLNAVNTYTGETRVTGGTTLGGSGSILSATLSGASTLAPGNSAGLFSASGNLSLFDSSKLEFEIGGTTRGTSYDALNVGGLLTIGFGQGIQLSLGFIGGFENSILGTDVFTLVMAGGLSGEFANAPSGARLATTDGLGSFLVHYGPGSAFGANNVVITDFIAVPEPSSALLLLSGLALLARRAACVRRRGSSRSFQQQ